MKKHTKPDCYGSLFPNLLEAEEGTLQGHSFRCVIEKTYAFEPPALRVDVIEDAWEACTRCPVLEDCYKLSSARLELQKALLEKTALHR